MAAIFDEDKKNVDTKIETWINVKWSRNVSAKEEFH